MGGGQLMGGGVTLHPDSFDWLSPHVELSYVRHVLPSYITSVSFPVLIPAVVF